MSDFKLEFDDEIQAPQETAEFSLEFDDNQPDFLKVKRDAVENSKDPINTLSMVAKNILGMVGSSSFSDVGEAVGNVAVNVVGGAIKNPETIGQYAKELPKTIVATGMKIGETAKNIKNIVDDKMETAELYEFQNDKVSDLVPELAKGYASELAVTTPKMVSDMAYWVGTNMKDPTGKKSNALSDTLLSISESMRNVSEYMGDVDLLKSKATALPDGSLSYGQIGNVLGHGMGQGTSMVIMGRTLGPKAAYGFYAGAGGADVFKQSYEKEGDLGKANTLATINAASTYMIDRWFDPLPENIATGARMTAKQVAKEVAKSTIKEPLAEGAQQIFAENLVRKIGLDAEQDLFEGVVESMIGAFGGAAAMGGGAVVSAYSAERHYQQAKEKAVELGASEGEVEQYKRATLAKLQQHPEAFDTVFQQNVQKTIQEIDAFVKENGNPEEVRKAMQVKADLDEVYNRVYEQIKTKDNDKVASAQAKVVQGVALWGAQELGISPLEYFEQRFPTIEKIAYRDFARRINKAKKAGEKVEINLYEALKNPNLLRGTRKKDNRISLTQFLKNRGGLIDAGGELKSRDASKQVIGLINNKSGIDFDDAALAAWEAGYFPNKMERPTINEFLDAIDDELRGNKKYASELEGVDLEQEVADLSEELDRADIDWRNMEPKEIEMAVDAYLERQRAYLEGMEEEDTGDNGLAWFQREAVDLANTINKIDAERLAFERKDINPDLKGRENEIVKAVVINRFFADKKASKDIKIDDVIAKIDETAEKNENDVRVLKNSVTGETATLSNAAIRKMFDTTRNREDTQNIGGILGKECIANIKDIFDSALLIKTHDDKKHGSKNKIRRYANVIQSDGENFIVKLTIKEMADNRNELTDIEIEGNNGRDLATYDLKVGKKNTAEGNTSVVTSEKTLPTALPNGNDIIIDDLIEFVNTYTEKTININGVEKPTTNSNGGRIAKTVEGLEAFYEWFGDSKVVDEQGRPLVVYHGTNKEFDSFDKKLLGTTTLAYSAKQGFFFTDSEEVANSYGDYAAIYQPINELRKKQEMAERWGDWDTVDELTIKIEELDRKISQTPANERGQKIYPVYLKADNVLEYDAKGEYFSDIGDEINNVLLKAKNQGKDGVVLKNLKDQPLVFDEKEANHFVVFEPNQIKSTSNIGTFDPNNNRIYYQGGEDKVYSVFDLKVGDSLVAFGIVEEINQTDRQIRIGGQWHSMFMLDMEANRFGLTLGPKEEIDISEDVEEEVKKVSDDRSVVEGQKSNNAEYNKIAEDYFGITNNLDLGGYILTDGNLLDLSGKKLGSDGKTRSIDHREISDAFEDNNVSMEDFINSGNIRYMPESNSVLMADIPNSKQYKIIEEIINRANGQVNIELMSDANNWGSFRDYSREYPDGTTLATIKRDINAFYKGEGVRSITTYFQSAFHGTPHPELEGGSFKLEKIGTGENAQAHGYGLYYTASYDVADKRYRERLTKPYTWFISFGEVEFDKKTGKYKNAFNETTLEFEVYKDFKLDAGEDIDVLLKSYEQTRFLDNRTDEKIAIVNKYKDYFVNNDVHNFSDESMATGQVYEVDLPENPYLLDEQKPFNEQSDIVKKGIIDTLNSMNLTDEQKARFRDNIENRRDTGKEIYEELIIAMAKSRGAGLQYSSKENMPFVSKALAENGVKGITYEGRQDGRCFVIFNPDDVKVIQKFYQDGADMLYRDPKGAFSQRINHRALISMFERADASTFMHETAHFFFEELKAFAKTSKKSADMLETINKWLGYDGVAYTEAQIEQFARGFEQYLREGKAPSKYLKRVFDAFMSWMRNLYKTARELHVQLNDDVRSVYANILGGTELDKYMDLSPAEVLGSTKKYWKAKREAMDEIYAQNNQAKKAERRLFGKVGQSMQKVYDGMRDYLSDAIVPLEEEIKQISPDLYNMNRRLEIGKLQKTSAYYRRIKGFVEGMNKMNEADFHTFDLALKNRDVDTVDRLLTKYELHNGFAEVRRILDDLREQMIDVGVDVAYMPDYFPRKIKDADGLLDYVEQEFGDRQEYSIIQKMIEEKRKDGRIRTKEDEAQIVNSLIRGYAGGISIAKIGNVKERSIDVVDQHMNKYYKVSSDALVDYISGAVQMIENKKYFGRETKELQNLRRMVANRETTISEYEAMEPQEAKWKEIKTRNYKIGAVEAQIRNTYDNGVKAELTDRKTKLEAEVEYLKDRRADQVKEIAITRMKVELAQVKKEVDALTDSKIENSVGNLLLEMAEQGKISHTQELRLKELLLARFSNKGLGNEFLRIIRDGGYIWTLGNFESAITQFGDLGTSAYKNGLWNTAFEYVKAWSGKSEITIEDLGLGKIIQDGGYADTSAWSQALDKVLKYTGFEKMDKIAKQTLVNSAIRKAREQAKAESPELEQYLRHEFGEKWVDVKEDLKTGAITDEIIEYAMFQLLDVQPITIDQMPRYYAEGGKKRLFYMMKSYFIKQLNEYRKVCFETAKTDPRKAVVDMLRLTAYLMLFNAGADLLKDLLFGRPINVADTIVDNIFIGGSINRYQAMSVKREGLFRTLQKQLLFPVMMDELIIDALSEKDVKDWNTWKNIPLVGRPYYWWFGGGHLKTEKEIKKQRNQRRNQRRRRRED